MQYSQFLIVGAGISGLSLARMLHERQKDYILVEKSNAPGGLIKCDVVDGHLFHKVGGHVFNTKIPAVASWFWNHFNKETEFLSAERNAAIILGDIQTKYPIENFIYMLPENLSRQVISELMGLLADEKKNRNFSNFEAFLQGNFGPTLYKIYFEPLNKKIWNTDLSAVPLPWLDGKLPMPDYKEILINNILRNQESKMVHSRFFYPLKNGSQFIANRFAEGLNLQTDTAVNSIEYKNKQWIVNQSFSAEHIIYTGDVRELATILHGLPLSSFSKLDSIKNLLSNGTSNLLCETDETDLSWLYLPGNETPAHRIIFTGNFSSENNPANSRRSCTVEFSGKTSLETMKNSIKKLPFNLKYIHHNYEPNSYVIQRKGDRERISALKADLNLVNFHLVGRFSEWEYHNMDKAIESGMKLIQNLFP